MGAWTNLLPTVFIEIVLQSVNNCELLNTFFSKQYISPFSPPAKYLPRAHAQG